MLTVSALLALLQDHEVGALQFSSLPHSHLVQIAQLELDGWNSRQPRSVAWSIKYQLASHKVKGRILHGQHQVRLVVVAVAAIDRSTRSQCASTRHHRRQQLVVVAVTLVVLLLSLITSSQ